MEPLWGANEALGDEEDAPPAMDDDLFDDEPEDAEDPDVDTATTDPATEVPTLGAQCR